MRPRFFLSVGRRRSDAVEIFDYEGSRLAALGMTALDVGPGAFLAIGNPAPVVFPGGVVVGELYRRGGGGVVRTVSEREAELITRSEGQELIDAFWGSYVAILRHPHTGALRVVRAPFGHLPCYIVTYADAVTAASDTSLLVALAEYHPSLDWTAIAWHLAIRDLRFPRTCLAGIEELHGGEALTIDLAAKRESIWSPWKFANNRERIRDEGAAVETVRQAVMSTLRVHAFDEASSILLLSGGIDSSIVAAALSAAGARYGCLTLTTRDRTGDEVEFARSVSGSAGHPLRIVQRDVAQIDVTRSLAARMPRPVARSFAQATHRAALAYARELGANRVLGGGGGDNVFCSLQSGGPAADVLRTYGPGRAFMATARDIGDLASVPISAVVRDAIGRALPPRKARPTTIDGRLLSTAALATALTAPDHAWFSPPRTVLPGKAGHVRLLAYALGYAESFDPLDELPMVAPLLAQPVVEACLRVPSWFWYDGGRNRMIARRAFQRELPPEIFHRRSKGSPESFVGEIFEQHRTTIRDQVLDGALVKHGLVDREAIEKIFIDPRPAYGTGFMRLLEFSDVEAWIAGCSSLRG